MRNERGAALVVVIVFSLLLSMLAATLIDLSFGRTTIFQKTRGSQHGALTAAAALGSLNSCLYERSFPPAGGCPGWTAWSCALGACRADWAGGFAQQAGVTEYALSAVWTSDGRLTIEAVDQP